MTSIIVINLLLLWLISDRGSMVGSSSNGDIITTNELDGIEDIST